MVFASHLQGEHLHPLQGGLLHPMSKAWQTSMDKMRLPWAAEELPLWNLCESFLLPQQEDRGGDGEGQGQDVKEAGVIQLGSRAGKCGTGGVAVLLTWGKRGK